LLVDKKEASTALTQGNLRVLDGKCRATLASNSGKPGSYSLQI
jgi:hypothetical protein